MKITSYVTSVLAFSLLIGGGSSVGLSGCAASSKSNNDLFGDDAGGDDGGLTHSDGGKHDGGGITPGDGGTGGDSATASGDCAAFCAKEATVMGCPSEAACNTTCQTNTGKIPAACQADFSAVLQCAVSPGMIASCTGTQAMISGCNTQLTTLTTCIQGAAGDGGTTMGDGGAGTKNCGQLIMCLNACAANDQACVNACFTSATPTAQADLTALQDCLFGTNGTSGACGSVCGTAGTTCTNCLNAAQMSGGACYTQLQTCSTNM